jgi:hypothetical protein
MKIVVLCEGYTERAVVSDLFSRWLNPRVTERIGFKPVRFNGWKQLVDDAPRKAAFHLRDPKVLGVVTLLDLYGPTFYPAHLKSAEERRVWGTEHLLDQLEESRYRPHFAVHEVEAWILAQPEILDPKVRKKLPGKAEKPEEVNSNQPPAKLLDQIYSEVLNKGYKKVVGGTKLFAKLDPEVVYAKCPAFKLLADDLLSLCPQEIRKKPADAS